MMIKDIVVSRAGVNSSVCDPVQWSENEQLAINNTDQITLLDPKLPNVHQSVISIENQKILDSRSLFTINTILDAEVLENLDIGKFNNVSVTSDNNGFDFTRINEPIIVKHQWSPKVTTTKDCYLGVLLNSGELMIFERSSVYADKYQSSIGFFHSVLAELGLEDKPDLEVDYDTFLRLKIKDFSFVKVDDICISVVNGLNELKLYSPDMTMLLIIPTYLQVVKHSVRWVGDSGYACVVTSANEVVLYFLSATGEEEKEIKVTGEQILLERSRFRVSHVEWHDSTLVISRATMLHVFELALGKQLTHSLTKQSWITNLIIVPADDKFEVIVSYEIGTFESLSIDLKASVIKPTSTCNALNKFVSQRLVKFQLQNSTTNVSDNERVTRNYLNITTEGNFLNFGAKLSSNGLLAIVYKIYPKNNLNYTINSKNEFSIGFVPLKTTLGLANGPGNPLAQLNGIMFADYESLEVFPRNFSLTNSSEFVDKFVQSMEQFKREHTTVKANHIPTQITHAASLKDFLVTNFTDNETVKQLQKAYNLNMVCLSSIQALYDKLVKHDFNRSETIQKIKTFKDELLVEQVNIEFFILEYLINIVFEYDYQVSEEVEMFMLMSYNQFLKGTKSVPFEASTISFDLSGIPESFTITKDDDFDQLIKSNSDHQWTRCKITLLPLLGKNAVDELSQFNYLITENQETLVGQLLHSLNYCVITGNKTFEA